MLILVNVKGVKNIIPLLLIVSTCGRFTNAQLNKSDFPFKPFDLGLKNSSTSFLRSLLFNL